MNYCKNIFCFIVLFAICVARKNNPPLKQLEGAWMIRNASENALPIIGKCPNMHIEPSQEDSNSEAVILFKSTVRTFTITVVNIDKETYQLFYPLDSGSALLGNVSFLHVDKNKFLITELHTEGQIYYAVLTKENKIKSDTDKRIEKIWKSSNPAKNVSLAATEYENCTEPTQEEISKETMESSTNPTTKSSENEQKESMIPSEPTNSSQGSISIYTTEKITSTEKSTSTVETTSLNSKTPWIEETKPTAVINNNDTTVSPSTIYSPTDSSYSSTPVPGPSSDKTHSLPIVGGKDITNKTKLRNAAESSVSSSTNLILTIGSLLFLFVNTVHI